LLHKLLLYDSWLDSNLAEALEIVNLDSQPNYHSLMSNLFGTQIERLFWSTNWANCAIYCWKLSSWWYWGRFHQHFTCAFFVQKFIQSQTLSREKLLKGLSYEKYLHKMLMKLTSEWHFSYQMPCACVIFLIWLKQPLKLCIGDNSCSSSSSQVGRGGWSILSRVYQLYSNSSFFEFYFVTNL